MSSMKKDDIDSVYRIEIEVNRNPWSKENFISSFDSPHVYSFVVRLHNAIIGFIIFSIIRDEFSILDVALAQKFQGIGYGRSLFSQVHSYALDHGARSAYLEVSNQNKRAINFYTKQGYGICGQRPKYYANEDDALLMRRTLCIG